MVPFVMIESDRVEEYVLKVHMVGTEKWKGACT